MYRRGWLKVGGGATAVIFAVLLFSVAYAASTGRVGYSGNPQTNTGATCGSCHYAKAGQEGEQVPEVKLSGPTVLMAGETVTYTLTITGGSAVAGGFNVSASAGLIAPLPGATDTKLLTSQIGDEITHTAAKRFDGAESIQFQLLYTAPATTQATLYGVGVSANMNRIFSGDGVALDTLEVQIEWPYATYLPLITTP